MKLHTPYFIYNGIDSRLMDIIVTAMPHTIRAAQRVESFKVPGRSGSLHKTDGAYDNYTKTMECAIKDREKIDEIAAWLTGSGEIIFSSEPDKIYRVTICNTISIAQMLKKFQSFQVSFDTYPFKYSVNAFDDIITLTSAKTILNNGTIFSQPIITITGSGAITLTINDKEYRITNLSGSITIDSDIEECYSGDVNMNNVFDAEQFPIFEVGENTISWSGNVQKVEINPNWRWL